MDQERFDLLLRTLATRPSRRIVLAGLTGGLFATLPLTLNIEEIKAKQKGKSRKHKKRTKHQGQPDSPPSPPPAPGTPPPPPAPVTRIDAICSGPSDSGMGVSNNGNHRYAQTFTALASGPLVSAQLVLIKQPASVNDYTLRLSPVNGFGTPTNTVLAVTAVSYFDVPDGTSTVTFTFTNPFSVVAGTTYALVLTRVGSNDLTWVGHDGDTCSGSAFGSFSQTEEFMGPISNLDLNFTTFVSS